MFTDLCIFPMPDNDAGTMLPYFQPRGRLKSGCYESHPFWVMGGIEPIRVRMSFFPTITITHLLLTPPLKPKPRLLKYVCKFKSCYISKRISFNGFYRYATSLTSKHLFRAKKRKTKRKRKISVSRMIIVHSTDPYVDSFIQATFSTMMSYQVREMFHTLALQVLRYRIWRTKRGALWQEEQGLTQ